MGGLNIMPLIHRFRPGVGVCLALSFSVLASALSAIELYPDRSSPQDLELRGKLSGVPAGESRFIRWSELKSLPTSSLTLPRAFGLPAPRVTALFLADLWAAVPHSLSADTILATCRDGYASVYPHEFITDFRPFIVLEIDGFGPADWSPPRFKYNIEPYVITIAAEVVPAVAQLLDGAHKRPWGAVSLEFANFSERFADAYRGKWAAVSPRAATGRDIWINSCASCHHGPGQMFGGTKSDRPFDLLVAQASSNPAYFRQYVRDPKSLVPGATMEPHPHYSDEQLDALIAFVTAEPK